MRRVFRSCSAVMIAAAAIGLCGCSTPQLSDQALKNPIPDPPVFSQLPLSTHLGGRDPLEGFNRCSFYVGDTFTYYIYRPVGYIYGSIMPRYGVNMINNATGNLEFPRRFLSSLFQAEFTWAGTEFLRFLTNSTIGIAGLFDPATHWFDIPEHNEDFGQAFASWGIGSGCVLQLGSSTNVRDGVGMAFDYAVDIKSYFYGGQAFTMLNRGLDPFNSYDTIRKSTFDSYQLLKDYQLLARYLQVNNIQGSVKPVELDSNNRVVGTVVRQAEAGENLTFMKDFYSQSPEIDTLRAGWFRPSYESVWSRLSFFNHDFSNLAQQGSVKVNKSYEITYRYWRSEKADAPLVIILPGVGGHNTADMAQALAELCVKNKFSALIVSNSMNWEFAEAFDTPPGYTPADAANLEWALIRVLDDLQKNQPDMKPARRILAGYSQGALNAIYLMDRQQRNNKLGIDRVLAINPPVDMLYALERLDAFMRSMDNIPSGEAIKRLATGVAVYMRNPRCPTPVVRIAGKTQTPGKNKSGAFFLIDQVPVDQKVAEILIGYSFKRSLDDMLVTMHHKAPVNGIVTRYEWGNRQSLYDELAMWNYKHYCNKVLLPYYQEKTRAGSIEDLNRSAGLRAMEDTLRSNRNITVFHNADDFLLTAADRKFLRDTLQERLVMFEHGGHLGNLYRQDVQQKIVDYLKQ